jgi:predicted ABC-type transport system involved in lysophospholipase L1 biosynthesis ATPase subunit
MSILSVKDLSIHIRSARPVDGVSFDIAAGECFALLGESGCGKSMTALGLMRLLPAAAEVAGGGHVRGPRVAGAARIRHARHSRRRHRHDLPGAGTSLNPVLTVGRQIVEALELHSTLRGAAARERAAELLDQVGIPDPRRRLDEYPFQLSGGLQPARDDRHRAGRRAAPPDRRRADHGARRDDTGAGAGPARRLAAHAGHGAAADHPRPRRGGAHGRPHRRHVCRATGGGGAA